MQLTFQIPNLTTIVNLYREAPTVVTPILQKYLDATQAVLGANTGQNTPYQTGKLITSFVLGSPAPLVRSWKPTVKYALYVEQGTGIYGPRGARIVPVAAKALAWTSGGKVNFYKSTKGMTPRRYMEKILAAATPQLVSLFQQAEEAIIQAMGIS